MKAIELQTFIQDNAIEWHVYKEYVPNDIIIFIPFDLIKDFHELLSNGIFDDGGIQCRMKDGYFVFFMNDICEYHGFEVEDVFVPK